MANFQFLHFSDGVSVPTDGPLRTLKLDDGWYVVGRGMLIPCKDEDEAQAHLAELKKRT